MSNALFLRYRGVRTSLHHHDMPTPTRSTDLVRILTLDGGVRGLRVRAGTPARKPIRPQFHQGAAPPLRRLLSLGPALAASPPSLGRPHMTAVHAIQESCRLPSTVPGHPRSLPADCLGWAPRLRLTQTPWPILHVEQLHSASVILVHFCSTPATPAMPCHGPGCN